MNSHLGDSPKMDESYLVASWTYVELMSLIELNALVKAVKFERPELELVSWLFGPNFSVFYVRDVSFCIGTGVIRTSVSLA